MRILTVSQLFYPDTVGGSERVIAEQVRGLAKRGHEVTVVTQRARGDLPDAETIDGARVIRYGTPRRRSLFGASHTDLTAGAAALRRLLAAESFDVVVLHHPFPALAYFRSRGANMAPALYVFHASVYRELLHEKGMKRPIARSTVGSLVSRVAGPLLLRRVRKAEHTVLTRSQKIAVLSAFSKRLVMETYGIDASAIAMIPGGVDAETYKPHPNVRALRMRLRLPESRTIILTVRRLVPRTGVAEFVQAAERVLRTDIDAQFLVIGDGPERERLVTLARKLGVTRSVTFLGFVPPRDLPDYYAAADLFVLPTVAYEGFGIATLEALAAGTPVLGTSVGATPEILGELDPALVVAEPTADALADGIGRFLGRTPQDRDALRRKARDLAVTSYPWSRTIDALETELIKLAAMMKRE